MLWHIVPCVCFIRFLTKQWPEVKWYQERYYSQRFCQKVSQLRYFCFGYFNKRNSLFFFWKFMTATVFLQQQVLSIPIHYTLYVYYAQIQLDTMERANEKKVLRASCFMHKKLTILEHCQWNVVKRLLFCLLIFLAYWLIGLWWMYICLSSIDYTKKIFQKVKIDSQPAVTNDFCVCLYQIKYRLQTINRKI